VAKTMARYTYNPKPYGELISQRRWDGAAWQTRFHRYDALGSTRALTDEMGAETDSYTYDAWGNEIAPTSSFENPFRWVGRWVLLGCGIGQLLRASAEYIKPASGTLVKPRSVGIRILFPYEVNENSGLEKFFVRIRSWTTRTASGSPA